MKKVMNDFQHLLTLLWQVSELSFPYLNNDYYNNYTFYGHVDGVCFGIWSELS